MNMIIFIFRLFS